MGVESRTLTGRAARQQHVDLTFDLKIDHAPQRILIDRAIRLERRDKGRTRSLKWFLSHAVPFSTHNSTSSIV